MLQSIVAIGADLRWLPGVSGRSNPGDRRHAAQRRVSRSAGGSAPAWRPCSRRSHRFRGRLPLFSLSLFELSFESLLDESGREELDDSFSFSLSLLFPWPCRWPRRPPGCRSCRSRCPSARSRRRRRPCEARRRTPGTGQRVVRELLDGLEPVPARRAGVFVGRQWTPPCGARWHSLPETAKSTRTAVGPRQSGRAPGRRLLPVTDRS